MILDRLADATRARYARRMTDTPLDIVKSRALALPKGNFAFERALEAPEVSLICEVKKASPSKGLISPDFPYLGHCPGLRSRRSCCHQLPDGAGLLSGRRPLPARDCGGSAHSRAA